MKKLSKLNDTLKISNKFEKNKDDTQGETFCVKCEIKKLSKVKNPRYLYRPNDYSILVEIEKNSMVFVDSLKLNYPTPHDYDYLIEIGFIPCTEKDFPFLKEKNKEYWEYYNWATRSDGHGGVKGGTIEEFRKRKKLYLK